MRIAYVGRGLIHPQVEGHYVASRRIVSVASQSREITPYLITVEQNGKADETVSAKCLFVNPVLTPPVKFSFLPSLFLSLNDLLVSAKVLCQLRFLRSDLVHILNINKEAYLAIHFLLRLNKPLLIHFFHSPHVLNDDVFLIRKMAFKAGLYDRLFHNHISCSNISLRNFLIQKLSMDSEHVHYLPFPIDTEKFRPLDKNDVRRKYNIPEDNPLIVYAGSLHPARGIFDLLRSFSYILSDLPRAILYISYLQREGEEVQEKHLYELIRRLRLQNHVVIRGFNPNIEEIYAMADVVTLPFVRPYWIDPPLVLLEAMSCGAVVISSSVGAISEVIKENQNGILTKPQDPILLAKAMIELLSDAHQRRRISRNARKTAVETHSYQRVKDKLMNIYSKIQNNRDS